jgi:hypothetical protein
VNFLRRKVRAGQGIGEFWRWWATVRVQVERSVEGADWDDKLIGEMSKKVAAIHPDLEWEFTKGATSRHSLVVSPCGNSKLRAIAERWRCAAPTSDTTWAYHSSRQADPDGFNASLTLDGHTVILEKMRFGVEVDPDRHEIDVTSFHPIFSVMTDQEQIRVTFLALDWALGEQAVELWVGRVAAERTEPQRPHTATQLRSAVTNLAQKEAEASWAIISAERQDGYGVVASVQLPLKPARWPRFDTHVRLVLPYREIRENGFPGDTSLAALRAFADRLVAAVGVDGELVAHESTKGSRTFHLYVDGMTGAADAAKRLLSGWREGKPTLSTSFDPSWQGTSHLRP